MNNTPNRLLPTDMCRDNTCCFTGHRKLPSRSIGDITDKLRHSIRILSSSGFRYYVCGGALGFDMLAEQILLDEAKTDAGIHLVLALPCRDQTNKWLSPRVSGAGISGGTDGGNVGILRDYMAIKAAASAVYYVNDFYTDECMKERNRFMVDKSSFCVAYYNGSVRSGSGQTFRMAQKAGLKIYNIADAL